MTLGTKKQQRELLKSNCTQEWMIKRELVSGKVEMNEALFDPKLYTGPRIVDLFDEEDENAGYATDRAEFHALQMAEIEKRVKRDKKKWLFVRITAIDSYDIKKIDDKPVEKHYGTDHMDAKEKLTYGRIYHLDPDSCRIQITNGWRFKTEKKKTVKKVTEVEVKGLTQKQHKIMAQAHIAMHTVEATLEDALVFYLVKRMSVSDAKKVRKMSLKELTAAFIHEVETYASNAHAEQAIVVTQKKRKWSLRKNWTPDEEFIKSYNQDMLTLIAKQCEIKLSGCPKKSQKVDRLVKAFAKGEGKTKTWLPS